MAKWKPKEENIWRKKAPTFSFIYTNYPSSKLSGEAHSFSISTFWGDLYYMIITLTVIIFMLVYFLSSWLWKTQENRPVLFNTIVPEFWILHDTQSTLNRHLLRKGKKICCHRGNSGRLYGLAPQNRPSLSLTWCTQVPALWKQNSYRKTKLQYRIFNVKRIILYY